MKTTKINALSFSLSLPCVREATETLVKTPEQARAALADTADLAAVRPAPRLAALARSTGRGHGRRAFAPRPSPPSARFLALFCSGAVAPRPAALSASPTR